LARINTSQKNIRYLQQAPLSYLILPFFPSLLRPQNNRRAYNFFPIGIRPIPNIRRMWLRPTVQFFQSLAYVFSIR
jgi:hypothetical protein